MEKSKTNTDSVGVNLSAPVRETTLYLTNNRSTQQDDRVKEAIRRSRKKNHGKPFQLLKKPPGFCKSLKSVFFKIDEKGKAYLALFKGLPCNQWSCPVCGPIKAKRLRYYLIELIKLNQLNRLLTLTLDSKKIPKEYLIPINRTGQYCTYLFNRFKTHLVEKFKKKIKHVWIKEFQANGNAHLHILINTYLPLRYLEKVWSRMGGGQIMDIQLIRNIEATAVYITGYLMKGFKKGEENIVTGFITGERRYSISQDCIRPEAIKGSIQKITSIRELRNILTYKQYWLVYNNLQNSDTADKELLLAPHQEKIKT